MQDWPITVQIEYLENLLPHVIEILDYSSFFKCCSPNMNKVKDRHLTKKIRRKIKDSGF